MIFFFFLIKLELAELQFFSPFLYVVMKSQFDLHFLPHTWEIFLYRLGALVRSLNIF